MSAYNNPKLEKAKKRIAEAKNSKSTTLNLSNCGITDLRSDVPELFEGMQLLFLNLNNNELTDISALAELKQLVELNLPNNQVSDISALAELKQLVELNLPNNQVSDIAPVNELKNLTWLDFSNNQVSDIAPVSELKNLTDLYFVKNQVSDIAPISELKNLTRLDFSDNQVSNIAPVSELKNLTSLKFLTNKVSNIAPISELEKLTWLSFANNKVSDIASISELKNLTSLNFSNNKVSDIAPVSKIKPLIWLYFSHNQVSDLTPIAPIIDNLEVFEYKNNPITAPPPEVCEQGLVALKKYFQENHTQNTTKVENPPATEQIETENPIIEETTTEETPATQNPTHTTQNPALKTQKPNHHRYLADDSSGIDYLDITNDVNAFANLMVQKDLPMPMAVGLFGHWGSGKSFFMSKLYDRVEDLKGKSTGNRHLRHIVQVRFNAWHYAEQNLWHSITAIIFGELVGFANKGKNKNPIELYEELKNKSKSFEDEIAEKEAEKEQLTQAQREREIQLLKNLPYELTSSFWEELKKNKDVQAVLKEWGIVDAEFSKVQALIEAKRAEWGIVQEDLKTIFHSPKLRVYFFVKKAFFPFMIAILIWIALLVDWEVMKTQVSKIVALVVSGMSVLYPFIPLIEKWLAGSKAIISSIANDIKNIKKENQAALDAIDKEIEKIRARKEKTDQTLDIWRKGQRLLDFINNPDLVDKYTKLLGHITMIRKDFEALKSESNFISAFAEESEEKFNIERIILYIDDLDRCEEDKVVEVLEIVHLLMGLENGLFVTVVGVDPRWLVRSLHTKYSNLLSGDEKSANAFDYLEKIFQIPFRIQALSRETTEKLLKGLVQVKIEPKATTTKEEKPDISNAPKTENTVEEHEPITTVNDIPDTKTENQEKEQTKTVETEPEIFSLEMSQDELNWMSALTEKIGKNPRSVKRFVNIYSILRVHEDTPAYSDENQTDFKCILLILSFLFDPKCNVDFEKPIGEEDFNAQILTETLKKTFEGVTTELFNKYLPLVRKYSFPEIEKKQ